jgi:hypothetical protein
LPYTQPGEDVRDLLGLILSVVEQQELVAQRKFAEKFTGLKSGASSS